jgi:hypothetical protein
MLETVSEIRKTRMDFFVWRIFAFPLIGCSPGISTLLLQESTLSRLKRSVSSEVLCESLGMFTLAHRRTQAQERCLEPRSTQNTHTHTCSMRLCVLIVSVCVSVSVMRVSVWYRSLCVSACLCVFVFVCLPVCRCVSMRVSLCLCVCLCDYVSLSLCLSVCHCVSLRVSVCVSRLSMSHCVSV